LVTLFTGVNLVVTLINQVVLAYLFGAGTSMDAFLACGAVPFVVLNLAIGDLGYILVPLLMQYTQGLELKRAIDATFTAVLSASIVVTILGISMHREILRWTTSRDMPTATFELAVSLAPVVWVVIGFTLLGSFLTGQHYHLRRFTVPAVTLVLPYLGMIIGGLVAGRRIGMEAVVIGWAVGTGSRDAVLYATLGSHRPELTLRLRHPAVKRLLRCLPPLGISLLPFASLPMIDVFWASRLPVGSISYLGYSTRIVIAIASLVVQGVSVVIFPDLSADAKAGNFDAFRSKAGGAMIFIFCLIVPLACLVYLVRVPFLEVFLQRGRFTAASSTGVARVLPFYLFGTIWMAMMNVVSRSFYALDDYISPAISGLVVLVGYVILSGTLIKPFSYLGIGVAYSVFWIVLLFAQTQQLGRRVGILIDWSFGETLLRVLFCGCASLALLDLPQRWILARFSLFAVALLDISFFSILFFSMATLVFRIRQYAIFASSAASVCRRMLGHRNHG
jgi:putative peptidoglycan lipid II flippase